MSKSYNANSITRLKGLEGVRIRPGVYVGDTDHRGYLHLVKEIFGNSIDEATNGYGDTIAIDITKDGEVTVFDTGRGIPTGPHKSDKTMDTLEILLTELHTGGKLKDTEKNYQTAIGSNGMGLAVVNALSTSMTVWTKLSGKWQCQSYSKGKPTSKVIAAKSVPSFNGKKWPHGTIVRFKPDSSIFEKGSKLKLADVRQWIENLSWFVFGPKKSKKDISGSPITIHMNLGGKSITIRRKSLADYASHVMKKKGMPALELPRLKPFVFSSKTCDVTYYPTAATESHLYSSVNSVETISGGTHVTALRKALTDTLAKFKKKRDTFSLDDFLLGSVLCCNVKMINTQFNSQSKEQLKSKIENQFEGLDKALEHWFRANKKSIIALMQRANELSSLNTNAALNRKLASALKVKKNGKNLLPAKLVGCTTKNRDERELFIVEGDSANGTGRKASDRRFQEILPLRGKIMNVVKDKNGKDIKSEAILDILKTIGWSPKTDFTKSRRVGKVYFLTDPDPDGSHISTLLAGLLYSVVPQIFIEGRVYNVEAPLYSGKTSNGTVYGSSVSDLVAKAGKSLKQNSVVRMKGWGEANSEDLKDIAFDLDKRKVKLISTEDASASRKAMFDMLGENAEARRTILGI